MVLAAVVAMGPALKAAVHAGLQVESGRQSQHPDATRLAAIEAECEIGHSDGLAERIVGPFDRMLDRGHLAMRNRSVSPAAKFGSREVMWLAGRALLDEDRQRRLRKLEHRPGPEEIAMG